MKMDSGKRSSGRGRTYLGAWLPFPIRGKGPTGRGSACCSGLSGQDERIHGDFHFVGGGNAHKLFKESPGLSDAWNSGQGKPTPEPRSWLLLSVAESFGGGVCLNQVACPPGAADLFFAAGAGMAVVFDGIDDGRVGLLTCPHDSLQRAAGDAPIVRPFPGDGVSRCGTRQEIAMNMLTRSLVAGVILLGFTGFGGTGSAHKSPVVVDANSNRIAH